MAKASLGRPPRCHSSASAVSDSTARAANPTGAKPATAMTPASAAPPSRRSSGLGGILIKCYRCGGRCCRSAAGQGLHLQHVQPAAVAAQHLEAQALDGHGLAALGQAAKALDEQAAYGVETVVRKIGAEGAVEVGDLGARLDPERA